MQKIEMQSSISEAEAKHLESVTNLAAELVWVSESGSWLVHVSISVTLKKPHYTSFCWKPTCVLLCGNS